ncbi:MAG: protein kinase, partial [Propionibacteriaceae bacterium]|nr:protein kinase [Propionibacteriaceae bacterium]
MMQTNIMLDGRYLLGDQIGEGGMAEVCRARDLRMGREVAVKRLKPDLAKDPHFRQRFLREIQAVSGHRHPNVVAVFDTGEYFDEISQVQIPYLVMELLDGETLSDQLKAGGRFPLTTALEITRSVLAALNHSHQQGVIHRDVKPANVMLPSTGEVKVMDFGIARIENAETLTGVTSVLGTPQYLSPEQIEGGKVDARSDIYATGCLLYELITGQPPFSGPTPVLVAIQHLQTPAPSPSQIVPELPSLIDEICSKALAKSPADRFQTADQMRAALSQLSPDNTIQLALSAIEESTPKPSAGDDTLVKIRLATSPAETTPSKTT